MTMPHATLGTLLRSLLDALDPAVEDAYLKLGLDFRPRYTPVFRALVRVGPMRIKDIAEGSGLTHSAVSQTVSALLERGLVRLEPGQDSRERIVHLTDYALSQIPGIEQQWAVTARAAATLSEDIGLPLEQVLRDAKQALERVSFATRLVQARAEMLGGVEDSVPARRPKRAKKNVSHPTMAKTRLRARSAKQK